MLETIISGGEAGAELGALRAAEAVGLRSAGEMAGAVPADGDSVTDADGPHDAARLPGMSQSDRIEWNVKQADATLWFGETHTPRAQLTVDACRRLGKPCLPVDPCAAFEPSDVAAWIAGEGVATLHVTGSLEAEEPGIADRVERFLDQVFREFLLPES
jgi:hypothetical protein